MKQGPVFGGKYTTSDTPLSSIFAMNFRCNVRKFLFLEIFVKNHVDLMVN